MKEDTNSNPAFPSGFGVKYQGMSLRDWFAGMALFTRNTEHYDSWDEMASDCYGIADAMLRRRNKQ